MWAELPEPVRRHLEQEVLQQALLSWFRVDGEGVVRDRGAVRADLAFGAEPGDRLEDRLEAVVGLLPLAGESLRLRALRVGPELVVDLHAFEEGPSTWVLLVDEGRHHEALSGLLQRVNEEELSRAQREGVADRVDDVLRALDVALFEPLEAGGLRLLAAPPPWLAPLRPGLAPGQSLSVSELSDFAGDFLEHAGATATRVTRSLPWVEDVPGQGPMVRECIAGRTETRRPFVAIRRLGSDLQDRVAPLQAGRDLSLLHEALGRQLEQRETLFHCIVHDLAAPLTNLLSALELLVDEGELTEGQRALVVTARSEGFRQSALIHTILDVFRSERSGASSGDDAIGLLATIEALRPAFETACAIRGLRLALDLEPEGELRVRAEAMRLQRVLQNLLENALRVSPSGGEVRISARRAPGGLLTLAVDDEGPGVPPSAQKMLFEKLRPSGFLGGKLGLGLYFCRITVESWGGRITQENLHPVGCRFQVTLPEV